MQHFFHSADMYPGAYTYRNTKLITPALFYILVENESYNDVPLHLLILAAEPTACIDLTCADDDIVVTSSTLPVVDLTNIIDSPIVVCGTLSFIPDCN